MDLSEDQVRQVASVAAAHGLAMVLLFGSTVAGGEHARSDRDVAVQYAGTPADFRGLARLQHALQEVFPEREVDLAVINRADPLFLKKITECCELVYGDPRALEELKIYAFKRYQDHRRFFAMERAYVERFLRERAVR
jgi:predicted nucleotidyltransferase